MLILPVCATHASQLGRTLLLYAARAGQLATVKWLYEQHAPLDSMDKEGRNALHYAARRGHLEVATWLLEHGVSVQQTDMVRARGVWLRVLLQEPVCGCSCYCAGD